MLRTVFSVIFTMIVSFFVGWFAHGAVGDVFIGRAEAIDGTTLRVGRSEFELFGISSPDPATPLGVEARDYLGFVMTDQFIWCRHKGDMNGDRRIGKCYAGFENLNDRMVAEGFARDCFATSNGNYAELEARARGMGRGMWTDDRMPEPPKKCRMAEVDPEAEMELESAPDSEAVDQPAEEVLPIFDDVMPEDSVAPATEDMTDEDIDASPADEAPATDEMSADEL